MGGLSRNGGLPYYIEVFLEIPHDPAKGVLECFWNGGVLTPLPTIFYHWDFHTVLVDCGYFVARFQNCFYYLPHMSHNFT